MIEHDIILEVKDTLIDTKKNEHLRYINLISSEMIGPGIGAAIFFSTIFLYLIFGEPAIIIAVIFQIGIIIYALISTKKIQKQWMCEYLIVWYAWILYGVSFGLIYTNNSFLNFGIFPYIATSLNIGIILCINYGPLSPSNINIMVGWLCLIAGIDMCFPLSDNNFTTSLWKTSSRILLSLILYFLLSRKYVACDFLDVFEGDPKKQMNIGMIARANKIMGMKLIISLQYILFGQFEVSLIFYIIHLIYLTQKIATSMIGFGFNIGNKSMFFSSEIDNPPVYINNDSESEEEEEEEEEEEKEGVIEKEIRVREKKGDDRSKSEIRDIIGSQDTQKKSVTEKEDPSVNGRGIKK